MPEPHADGAPDALGARWLAAMRAGDWERAWQATDALEAPRRAGGPRQPHHLCWDGTPPDSRVVRVRCEHGLGDTLQALRFLPALAARAARLHLMLQPPLVPLLRGVPGVGQVHDGWQGAASWPAAEVEIEVTELAYAVRALPGRLPPADPGIGARLPAFALPGDAADRRPRIGLCWAASGWDPARSVALQALAPLLALPQLRWLGLQQGPERDDPALAGLPVEPLWQRTTAVADCAAAMLALDALVLVDGMPAHLAGLLGRPAWLLLQHRCDWRWGRSGSRTPWYPSLQLVRQPAPGDWDGAVARLRAALLARWPTCGRGPG